jgi:protein-disulfide isomerase
MQLVTRVGAGLVTLSLLALSACDAPKPEEVTGLQTRLDTLVAEQAESRKQIEALQQTLNTAQEQATVQASTVQAMRDELTAAKDQLTALQTKVDTAPVKPTTPTLAGRPDPLERYNVALGDATTEGAADAKVTLVIFSDFQCPFCARAQKTLEELQTHYGTDLRLVAKHNPLPMHPQADFAARACEAAGKQGKFWEMYAELFENTKALSDAEVEAYAKDLKLDLKQWKVDMASTSIKDRIEADKKQARELGAMGTPAFFINGKYLSGAQPFEKFKATIDAEIVEADKIIAGGVSRGRLYDELMAKSKPGPGKPSFEK